MKAGFAMFAGMAFVALATATRAEPRDSVPQGDLLLFRDVGPRNALHPTNGPAHSVSVAPGIAFSSTISGALSPITDSDAAIIASGPNRLPLLGQAAMLPDQQFLPVGPASSSHLGAGASIGIGGKVSGAVGDAVGAIQNALGCRSGC